ncbi:NAD(P)/FAD-dependent oxidoreductase [Aquabacterium sp.]|uniref:NAD(P)/FAD-dependent oxidoreductase n=1 Tax=Aquabacterium sp. TaxID=1872578 RepID=UPI0035B2F25B
MQTFDVIVIGAGAAGLFAAGRAGQAGLSVVLIDHAEQLAEKIRISGGGRCNFTNLEAGPANYLSENPHFCRSALAGYTPQDFLALLKRYNVPWHEKHKGQLFCDRSAEDIIALLAAECDAGRVQRWQPCSVQAVRPCADGPQRFELTTSRGPVRGRHLVVATGGLSIPKIGATDFGLRVAKQFGHTIVEPRPALVPLTFDATEWQPFAELAGLSLEVDVSVPPPPGAKGKAARQGPAFVEDLLFTHRGLSGPAILQISSFWRPGQPLTLNLAPHADLAKSLKAAKQTSKKQLATELTQLLPTRLAQTFLAVHQLPGTKPLPECRDADLDHAAQSLQRWTLTPNGSEGWRKAEVMAGGVDTRELSSQTMESQRTPGLYFIGEVVDVTGWLGGYNFQWAWASAAACARALAAD